jgi:hypothetical protein
MESLRDFASRFCCTFLYNMRMIFAVDSAYGALMYHRIAAAGQALTLVDLVHVGTRPA